MNENTNDTTSSVDTPSYDSAPVDTSSDQSVAEEPQVAAPAAEEAPQEETPAAEEPTSEEQPNEPEKEDRGVTAAELEELRKKSQYQAAEIEADLLDEYGYVDPKKLEGFLAENNKRVFEQAVQAMEARQEAKEIETKTWESIYKKYPEVKEKESLEKALRGARIADIVAGGDGDITRIATEFMAPIRDSKVAAIESVNRKISEQKSLETNVQEAATPERPAPSLMSQLKSALASGDTAKAQQVRNAIRMQRIHDTTKE